MTAAACILSSWISGVCKACAHIKNQIQGSSRKADTPVGLVDLGTWKESEREREQLLAVVFIGVAGLCTHPLWAVSGLISKSRLRARFSLLYSLASCLVHCG